MRRIVREIATNELENLGDISTLADPSVVDKLIQNSLVEGEQWLKKPPFSLC